MMNQYVFFFIHYYEFNVAEHKDTNGDSSSLLQTISRISPHFFGLILQKQSLMIILLIQVLQD